ncbi:MAG: metallopeptidase TldD-related protein [Acidobacteriota bacterium]
MDGLAPVVEALARKKPKAWELYLWQELRLQFSWTGTQISRLAARTRAACSLREENSLLAVDGCGREHLARLLGAKPRALPAWSWDGELTLPDPQVLALLLPGLPLQVGVTTSRIAVVRADGAFAASRPVVVDATNQAGETFTWVFGDNPPNLEEAQSGNAAPPGGGFRALLHPQAAAVLCHELFGHPLEADSFFARQSPWTGRMGTRITSVPLHVVDDPTLPLPGGFLRDDEGEAARPKPLVTAGVLTGVLADRSYGASWAAEPGNARRASPHHPPMPRLSNLIAWVEGGDATPPLAEARVEIVRVRSGLFVPAECVLLLAVSESYTLFRGKRKQKLAPFFLKLPLDASGPRILAGGSPSVTVAEPGWCGKNHQFLPVGAAASWLLLERVEAA